jgi:chemotaxis protein MotC
VRRLALALALVALAGPAAAGEGGAKRDAPAITPIVGPPTPFSDMMLDVQRLQARMAHGDRQAYADQRARMKAIGAALAAADSKAFQVKAEREAVVLYLLSGGQPKYVADIEERGDFPEAERDLLTGAEGYTLGRQDDAEKLLPYDARTQSLRLGSQLAYAQSVLLTSKDPKKALALLDLARVLAPGSLIEEAALRRQIILVGDLHDPDRVAFLARQYVERFGNSLYAGDFVRTLATTAIHFDLCATPADFAKFVALLELAPPEQARAFMLAISRASLLLGRLEVAAVSAQGALKKSEAGSPDAARARAYDLLSRFPKMSEDQYGAALAAIAVDKLPAPDRDLLAAAGYLRDRLYELPPLAVYEDAWREMSVAAARSPDLPKDDSPAAVTIRRADAALVKSEALGDGGRRP